MTENMKKFLEAASGNEELCEKLSKMDKEALIAAAKELGIELTDADFAQPTGELNDDELDAVAGGYNATCICAVGGGGKADNNDKVCVCVLCGSGEDKKGNGRCFCSIAGSGWDNRG